MYCVICLCNNASIAFCPLCLKKVDKIFSNKQKVIEDTTLNRFSKLPMPKQKEVISLTRARLKASIENEVLEHFDLNAVISEYIQMIQLGHKKLEIPVRKKNDDIRRRSYRQYLPPKKEYQ